jgi:signal transduction histidine kinase
MVYYWGKEFYIQESENQLLDNLEILSFEIDKKTDLEQIAKKIKKRLNLRLTIISEDGIVIAESHKDKTKMDNHRYRDEIVQSDKNGFGKKIRHSKSINKDLLYIAKKYSYEDRVLYLRLAKELNSINEKIFYLGVKVLIVLTVFFILILLITLKISKQIQIEIQKISNFLTSIAKKKKVTQIRSNYSKEFFDITKYLSKISQILYKKDKKKLKYTDKLKLSNRQKDDIISAISHEFKNPIAVINGYAQTLLEDEELNPEIRKKFLNKIYNNGVKLSSLIDTLRLSIKLDSGKQTISKLDVNLLKLIQDSVEGIKLSYPKRETVIKGDKDIFIKGDEALLGIVVSNLVENAFKYSEDKVIINFNADYLEVIDSGIGISEKNINNITNKFFRVHENSWNNSLGLGLFIVNNILNLHNFSINIKSKENEGSTFRVIF